MNSVIAIVRSPTPVTVLGVVGMTVAAYGLTTHNPFHAMLCAVPALAASLCALAHTVATPPRERSSVFTLFIPLFLLLAYVQIFA